MDAAEEALIRFLETGNRRFLEILARHKHRIRWIEADIINSVLIVKINFGLFRTRGFRVPKNRIDFALRLLPQVSELGIHVKRPRIKGALPPALRKRIAATFG